jgi:hypothetical protein
MVGNTNDELKLCSFFSFVFVHACVTKHYEKAEQAHKAVKMLNEYEIAGQKLYVGVNKNKIFSLLFIFFILLSSLSNADKSDGQETLNKQLKRNPQLINKPCICMLSVVDKQQATASQ